MTSDAELVSRVAHTVRQHNLFQPGDTLVVGLSGGADSAALLDLLARLPDYNLHLIAAHLNHCLRSAESDGDEEFCRELAFSYAIPFEGRRVDVSKIAEERRLNLEDAGRRARIEFFDELRAKNSAAAVVLAHHADDQAETVLMRFLRGSGMTGLSGMAYRNSRGYVRPLLDISRSDIESYLRKRSLGWREDGSNGDTTYLRNRLRHELLPLLEGYNPAIRTCLASTASILSGDEALLEELTEQAFSEACTVAEGRIVCDVTHLRTLKPALLRRVLRLSFKRVSGTLEGLALRHIDALNDLLAAARPNLQLSLPHGVTAVREYDQLLLHTGEVGCAMEYQLVIDEPGCYQLPGGGSLMVAETCAETFQSDSSSAYIDLAKIPFPWLVRTCRPGDRMTPFGMTGRKKVKDIFINRKIPLSERKRIPLLFYGEELVWIAGVCVSELCRINNQAATAVQVSWHI